MRNRHYFQNARKNINTDSLIHFGMEWNNTISPDTIQTVNENIVNGLTGGAQEAYIPNLRPYIQDGEVVITHGGNLYRIKVEPL